MATASAAKLSRMAGGLVVSTRPKASSASAAPSSRASLADTAPVVTGRWAVRLTWRSKSRSATSLTQQPAERISTVPSVNTASRCQPGKPSAAIHSADSVGQSSSSQPAGRSQRMSCRYRLNREGWAGPGAAGAAKVMRRFSRGAAAMTPCKPGRACPPTVGGPGLDPPMKTLNDFPITKKWPARHPDRLQLYSLPTPNGVKVSILLEELGLPYEPHLVSFSTQDQLSPEFLSLNPNNKIPAILDPDGPNGEPLALFESGAILLYLAAKTDRFMPTDIARRYEVLQWLMFQMGGVGPMFGQLGFFHKFAGKDFEDKRPRDRYVAETRRLLQVLDGQLRGRDWLVDEYGIADIATFPWVNNLVGFYGARELVGFDEFTEVERVLQAFLARPAVQRGLNIPARD
mmetsp:Transcript_33908/g.79383  ORF Transcript_33908/g.79383 Transcript_33908/m.79383 type:complete len:402 (+) Transcript_33908:1753-2958(+)